MTEIKNIIDMADPDSITLHYNGMRKYQEIENHLLCAANKVENDLYFTATKAITVRKFASGFNVTISNKE